MLELLHRDTVAQLTNDKSNIFKQNFGVDETEQTKYRILKMMENNDVKVWHVFWNVKLLRRKLQKQLYFVVNCILFKGVEIEVEEFLCSKTVTSTMLVMSRTATVSFGSCCCSQSYPIWGTGVIVPKARGQKREGSASLPWTKCVKNFRELVWSKWWMWSIPCEADEGHGSIIGGDWCKIVNYHHLFWESSLLAVTCTVASYKWGCKIGKEEFVCEYLWHSNNVTKIMEFPCKIPVRWDVVYV